MNDSSHETKAEVSASPSALRLRRAGAARGAGAGDGAVGAVPTIGGGSRARDEGDAVALVVSARRPQDLDALPDGGAGAISNTCPADAVRDLNALFCAVNRKLAVGGRYEGHLETAEIKRRRWFKGRPRWAALPPYAVHFGWHRVAPKLAPTRRLYYAVTGGRRQSVSKTEALGRLVYCGFKIVEAREEGGALHFVAEKRGDPSPAPAPSTGPLLKMKRVVRGGEVRVVYKLRTMHPYAEYLQAYVYAANALDENGKFKDDFRIASWGRFLRRTWLDELPMIVNMLRGELKLFGVRPLSEHYLSLYPDDLVALRLRHKPGLVPPLYADLPVGLENIFASERRYLEAYERAPLATDARYFAKALRRIVLDRARSQ